MTSPFARRIDAASHWRAALRERVGELQAFLKDHDLADDTALEQLAALDQRLSAEKLVVAFVAEFSRGKSELINAIFFADAGRRVLPATPGRTTMCPVELASEPGEPPSLALLPISTRLEGLPLADLRAQPERWQRIALDPQAPEQLSQALVEVMRTQWIAPEDARALGFWDDERPDDNPPVDDAGRVEVPQWRHALINYPHPLLRQGLVVLDTPGLNAIGAEPELTLGLLPSAHATVFILGADTGVTKSDLAIWRDHLGAAGVSRFVVLNKIDALLDPLASPRQIEAQIEAQRQATARTLGVPPERVFPLSARQALAARVAGDVPALEASRLTELENALALQLLPRRQQVLQQLVDATGQRVELQVARRLADTRRQLAEQTLELRGLRGKSSARVRLMLQRVDDETAEFEACTARLQALRTVHGRMLAEALDGLSSDRVRHEVDEMQAQVHASLLNLGAKKAFIAMCARLRDVFNAAQTRSHEIRDMLAASFTRLNTEFGFSLALPKDPDFARFEQELGLIEHSYVRYLGLTQALRLSQPKFMDQFRRMLVSKLRVVFENATSEVELWNKGASAQVEAQLRERRRGFRRRREALERVQTAAGELERRLAEIELQDRRMHHLLARVQELVSALQNLTLEADGDTQPLTIDLTLDLPEAAEPEPPAWPRAHAR